MAFLPELRIDCIFNPVRRMLAELAVADELQVRQPRHHTSERDGERGRQDQHPRPERGRDHAVRLT